MGPQKAGLIRQSSLQLINVYKNIRRLPAQPGSGEDKEAIRRSYKRKQEKILWTAIPCFAEPYRHDLIPIFLPIYSEIVTELSGPKAGLFCGPHISYRLSLFSLQRHFSVYYFLFRRCIEKTRKGPKKQGFSCRSFFSYFLLYFSGPTGQSFLFINSYDFFILFFTSNYWAQNAYFLFVCFIVCAQ